MDTLTIAVIGFFNVLCFFMGAMLGQKVVRGEKIEAPVINPLQAVREHREKKDAEIQQNRLETIMRNIEAYDGTSAGQEDVG